MPKRGAHERGESRQYELEGLATFTGVINTRLPAESQKRVTRKDKPINPQALIELYTRQLTWIYRAAEQGATIVLERIDDPNTTLTLHGEQSVLVGTSNACWRVKETSLDGLSLPELTEGAINAISAEHEAMQSEGRYRPRGPYIVHGKSRLVRK